MSISTSRLRQAARAAAFRCACSTTAANCCGGRERDGWGHYYLYSADGTLKNQITKGEFVAEQVTGVDEKNRVMYLTANGREESEDPYYFHEYSARLDGTGMKLLSPGSANHGIAMSDTGRFFIDNSRA